MGRIYFHKPPLLYIVTGLSLKAFGRSLLALRLPNLLAGSLTAALLFFRYAGARGLWAGLTAVLLLVSNSVWVTFARLCYTDILLAFFTVAAMFAVARDPRLDMPAARWSFIAFDAAAILTKSAAGILPLLALAAFGALGRARCARRSDEFCESSLGSRYSSHPGTFTNSSYTGSGSGQSTFRWICSSGVSILPCRARMKSPSGSISSACS